MDQKQILNDIILTQPEFLFREYYGRLCYFAFKFLNDSSLAEDVAQDAFLAYWNNRANVSDSPNAIKDFLYSSVRNSCLNIIRREKVIGRYLDAQSDEDFKEEVIIRSIVETEIINNLHVAINTLPVACRKVFELGYLEGLSNASIAEKLNISINTVRAQKQRGLKVLRVRFNVDPLTTVIFLYLCIDKYFHVL